VLDLVLAAVPGLGQTRDQLGLVDLVAPADDDRFDVLDPGAEAL